MINASKVSINGVGDRGCEAVEIERTGGQETWGEEMGDGWRYVKTYQRPYDVVVVAVLAVGWHLGVLSSVSSDGKAHEWDRGVALAREATGLPIQNPARGGAHLRRGCRGIERRSVAIFGAVHFSA